MIIGIPPDPPGGRVGVPPRSGGRQQTPLEGSIRGRGCERSPAKLFVLSPDPCLRSYRRAGVGPGPGVSNGPPSRAVNPRCGRYNPSQGQGRATTPTIRGPPSRADDQQTRAIPAPPIGQTRPVGFLDIRVLAQYGDTTPAPEGRLAGFPTGVGSRVRAETERGSGSVVVALGANRRPGPSRAGCWPSAPPPVFAIPGGT